MSLVLDAWIFLLLLVRGKLSESLVRGTLCMLMLRAVPPSTASELPSIPEDTHDCEVGERGEGEGDLLDDRRGALQGQPSPSPESPGEARGSARPVVTAAEADSGYSRGEYDPCSPRSVLLIHDRAICWGDRLSTS
jgi:hypothetical protein